MQRTSKDLRSTLAEELLRRGTALEELLRSRSRPVPERLRLARSELEVKLMKQARCEHRLAEARTELEQAATRLARELVAADRK